MRDACEQSGRSAAGHVPSGAIAGRHIASRHWTYARAYLINALDDNAD
jgi:hypothetical protein